MKRGFEKINTNLGNDSDDGSNKRSTFGGKKRRLKRTDEVEEEKTPIDDGYDSS